MDGELCRRRALRRRAFSGRRPSPTSCQPGPRQPDRAVPDRAGAGRRRRPGCAPLHVCCGRRHRRTHPSAAHALCHRCDRRPWRPGAAASPSLAASLQRAWAPDRPEAEGLLSAALILCADHELNVSAFTARCVASAGSTPYAVVIAALAALQGYKHGGHTAHAAALLSAAAHGIRPAIAGYLQGGDKLPGFGHPLYPDGDPRATCLLALLGDVYPAAPQVRLVDDVCAAVHAILGLRPTIDLALAALALTLGMPRHTPLAIFALGRTAGWIGHASEQYTLDQLIRPRARYTGPAPMDAQ